MKGFEQPVIKMYKKKHPHFVSADEFDTERSTSYRDITQRKHKPIVVTSSRKEGERLIANLENGDEENGGQKYFLHKRHRKLKSRNSEVSGLSERKVINSGVTTSLRKEKKSYRIYTIDHVDHIEEDIREENSQTEMLQGRPILNDCMNRKANNYLDQVKNRIKKKSFVNQSDYADSQKGVCFTKKDKEQLTINLRHRKFNKSKIDVLCQETEKSNRKSIKTSNNAYTVRSTINQMISKDNNPHQRSVTNCHISPNKRTIEMKIRKKTEIKLKKSNSEYHEENGRESIDEMKIEFNANKKNACFRKYMEFIDYSNKIKENMIHKKILKNFPEGRSLVLKNELPHQAIQFKHERLSVECAKSKEIYEIEETPCGKNETFDILEKENSKVFASNEFDCSSIPEINQSSFLSDNGKKEIAVTAFNIQRDQSNILMGCSPKKKKKKESKFSLICKSEMKQAFPDRFFA